MPNWIRIEHNLVLESTDADPKGRFHPDLKWVKAPSHVVAGMVKQEDGSFVVPEPAPDNAAPPPDLPVFVPLTPPPTSILSKLAFMNRFTLEELGGIYSAARSSVMVEVFLDKLRLAEHVDVADPQTIAGLQALADAGLLSKERLQEVLKWQPD